MSLASFRSPLTVWLCIALAMFLPLRTALAMTLGNGCPEHQRGLQHQAHVSAPGVNVVGTASDKVAMESPTMQHMANDVYTAMSDSGKPMSDSGKHCHHMDCCEGNGHHAHDCSHCNHCASASVFAILLPGVVMQFVVTAMDADSVAASRFYSRSSLPLLQPPSNS